MMKNTKHQRFDFKNQVGAIPAIGLGTAGIYEKEPCQMALDAGYRMIDTALAYKNHESVGEAFRSSGLAREDVFITTKVSFCPPSLDEKRSENVWQYDSLNTKGNELEAIDLCLKQLGLEYVDLLLVHNPTTSLEEYGAASLPHFFELFRHKRSTQAISPHILPDGSRMRDVLTKAKLSHVKCSSHDKEKALAVRKTTWKAVEKALDDGKCKFIGVSNYPAALLAEMETYAKVMPVANEVELTPWFARKELRDTAGRLGVVLIAYGTGNTWAIRKDDDETVRRIANKLDKSPMQVLLRWNYQNGIVSVPNSKSSAHIEENSDIFGWELSEEDMLCLDGLDEDYPLYWDPRPTLATIH